MKFLTYLTLSPCPAVGGGCTWLSDWQIELLRRCLGLLPDRGPYTEGEALTKLREGCVYALMLLQVCLGLETDSVVSGSILKFATDHHVLSTQQAFKTHKNPEWIRQVRPVVDRVLQSGGVSNLQLWNNTEGKLRNECNLREKYPSMAPFDFDILHIPDSVKPVVVKIGIVQYDAPSSFLGVEERVDAALKALGETEVKLVLIDLPFQKKGKSLLLSPKVIDLF